MKYFRLVQAQVDTAPLLAELQSQASAWTCDTSRQRRIDAQRRTQTIFLRQAVARRDVGLNENQDSVFSRQAAQFPRAVNFMADFARRMNATLSRASIVRLMPRSRVGRHVDSGSYYFIRDRFHLVLQSPQGSHLSAGGEAVRMMPGELWWFDNKQFHEAANESTDWRVHYIFDLLPDAYRPLAVNPISIADGYAASRL